MREGENGRVSLEGIALVLGMWIYALVLLLPRRVLAMRSRRRLPEGGSGRRFSPQTGGPVAIGSAAARPAAFDDVAVAYDFCVGPFSGPIFTAALDAMSPHLARSSRVLDVGCGPGAAVERVAPLLSGGEVVGVDVSAEMLRVARERTAKARIENVAFYQADAADLGQGLGDTFDLAYSCLVHHHFEDPQSAVRGIVGALRPGGAYAAIDATGPVLTKIATPLARAADPGWVGFPNRETLMTLLRAAGLERVTWTPLAPGIGMAMGWRP